MLWAFLIGTYMSDELRKRKTPLTPDEVAGVIQERIWTDHEKPLSEVEKEMAAHCGHLVICPNEGHYLLKCIGGVYSGKILRFFDSQEKAIAFVKNEGVRTRVQEVTFV